MFTAWPKLKDWIDASGEALRLIEHAAETARRWQEGGDNPQELWLGKRAKEVLAALKRFGKTSSPELERFLKPQPVLIAQLDQDELSHQDRLLIGQKLAEFGDPRPAVGLRPDGLPDMAWIEIPQGRIKLKGVDRVFEVKQFGMAKYPITNIQFRAFIDDRGYEYDVWWEGIAKSDATAEPRWKDANAPRETVSWYEAVAFCRWLSHRTGSNIRLPTEWEWQQAATGGDPTREYPWPGGWDAARCNSWECRLDKTTAVGLYPSGASRQGLLDMAGNVWEWCLNTYEHPDAPQSLRIDESNAARVRRGGSWYGEAVNLRVSTRYSYYAGNRYGNGGFRLAQDIEP